MSEIDKASERDGGDDPPRGFAPIELPSSFLQDCGTLYECMVDGRLTLGCRLRVSQCNSQRLAHGGFVLAFADIAMSRATGARTLNLSVDFMRPAPLGVWIEANVAVRKRSARLAFADTLITGAGRELARASGLFRPV